MIDEKKSDPEKGEEKGGPKFRTPRHLTKTGRYWFQRFSEALGDEQRLSILDAKALEILADVYAEYRALSDEVNKYGYVYETKMISGGKGLKANPAVIMRADAWKRFANLLRDFGMTPVSRLKFQDSDNDDGDSFLNDILKGMSDGSRATGD